MFWRRQPPARTFTDDLVDLLQDHERWTWGPHSSVIRHQAGFAICLGASYDPLAVRIIEPVDVPIYSDRDAGRIREAVLRMIAAKHRAHCASDADIDRAIVRINAEGVIIKEADDAS